MKIITDEKFLRIPSSKITLEEAPSLIKLLEESLRESEKNGQPGIGLAAPQIGISKQVAIIRLNKISIDLVNADIETSYDKALFDQEGCLSFPGKTLRTWRYKEIVVKNDVWPFNFIATELLAIAIQHEIGHLKGELYMDFAV